MVGGGGGCAPDAVAAGVVVVVVVVVIGWWWFVGVGGDVGGDDVGWHGCGGMQGRWRGGDGLVGWR